MLVNPERISAQSFRSGDSIPGWGKVIAPTGRTKLSLSVNELVMEIPERTDLSPKQGTNATRILTTVNGDFTITVNIVRMDTPPRPLAKGQSFHGAGILVWENENNFLRVERNAYWTGGELNCYPPLVEYWKNGSDAGYNQSPVPYSTYFRGPTWLRVQRVGQKITVFASHSPHLWNVVTFFESTFGNQVSIGIAGVNVGERPCDVAFSDLSLEPFAGNPELHDAICSIQKDFQRGASIRLMTYCNSHPNDDLGWAICANATKNASSINQVEGWNRAEEQFQKALAINPKQFRALEGLADVYRKRKQYKEAIEYLNRAIAVAPNFALSYVTLAQVKLQQKEDAAALSNAQKAFELDSSDSEAAAILAIAYHFNNDPTKRDQYRSVAKELGYSNNDFLLKLFDDQIKIRD